MSENTRLDIDSNIPQEMAKISRAAEDVAKKLDKVGSGSAFEELQRTIKQVSNEFKNLGGTVDKSFEKALKNLDSSAIPNSVKDAYRNALIIAKAGSKELALEYEKLNKSSENAAKRVAAAQAKIAKAESEGKTSIGAQKELKTASNILASLEGKFADARENAKNIKLFHLKLRDALNKEYNEFYLKRQATQKSANIQELQAFKDLGVKLQGEDAALYKRLLQNRKDFDAAVKAQTARATAQSVSPFSEISTGNIKNIAIFGPPASLFRQAAEAKAKEIEKIQQEALQRIVLRATVQAEGAYSSLRTQRVVQPIRAAAPELDKQLPGLSAGFRKLGDDMGYAHSFARGLASGFNLLWLTWGKLAPLFAGASISYGIAKTFQFGSEIEYNIRFLETLGDLTRTQGKVIREELRKMDESTMFSMTELSKTMITLGQAGYAAKESLHLTKVSADLATVGMTDMDTSVKLLTQAMELFKKPTEEAEKVSSQLYMATKSGKLNIEDLGGSFKYASTAGIGYGQSLESVLTAMASLADIGIKSTQAGTSYVNMLQDLSGRSKPAIAAMDSLKKAAASVGKTITVFDDTGKMRDAATIMFKIGEAIQLIKPSEQMKTLNALFTERGIRDYFAAVGKGEKQMTALQDAISKVDPQKVFKDAKNMQDTVKAGFEIMKSTLTSSLDRVFEANSGKFREFFTGMTDLIGSKEFINSVNLMVNAFSGLYETLKVVGPTLATVLGGLLAYKAVAMVQVVVTGAAKAYGSLIPVLDNLAYSAGKGVGAVAASAVSLREQGLALFTTGVQARNAAGGLEATALASSLAATNAKTASTQMKVLGVVMGFLTNPIVGVITTLGILGATWWATSRDSMTASEQLSNKVVENGRVNVKALNEEIAKLLERNAIVAENNPVAAKAAEAATDAKKQLDKVMLWDKKIASTTSETTKRNFTQYRDAEKAKLDIAVANWKAFSEGARDYAKEQAAQDKAAAEKRQRLIDEQIANAKKPPGTLDPNTPDGGTTSNRSFDQYASSLTRQLAALKTKTAEEKQMAQARMTETDALYKREIDLVEAKNKAGMLSEGEYQIAVIQTTQRAEAAKISLLEEAKKKVSEANLAELAQQQKIQVKALADFKGSKEARQDLIDSYADKVEAIQKQEVADTATYNAEIEKLKQESLFRIENASIEHQGKLIKLQKEADKYLADLKGERSKEAAVAALNKQYENVNDSSVIWLQAEKAAAMAAAEAVGKHEAKLREMEKAYEDVAKAEADMRQKASEHEKAGIAVPGLPEALTRLSEQRMALEKQNATARVAIEKDIADQGAIAYSEAFRKRASEFKNTVAQTLAEALVAGGNDGGKRLRKILEAELKAPFVLMFRMSIDALLGDLGKSVSGAAGSSEGGGGLSNAFSALSSASTMSSAYNALSGAIEGSIGKSFEKFALSDIGGKLGFSANQSFQLSSASQEAFAAMQNANGVAGEFGSTLTTTTKEVTSLGKTFTDVGTGIAAAFVGQGLRKGISGGYSVGGAGETVMDVAALAASYFGPVASIVTGAVSGLINRAFGRKLKDTGIQGQFGSQGFTGENYRFEKGGWFRSDMAKTSALDSSTTNTFTNTFRSIQASTAVLATNMGLSAQSAVDFKKDIKLSLKGLSAEEQSTAITKMFTDLQEEMAAAILDAWGDWSIVAKYGETASQVLTTVSNNLTGFNGMLSMLDLRLIDLSLSGAAAASSVIEAAGGVDELTGVYSSYYENFYSEAERNSKSIEILDEKFTALGVTMPALVKDAEGFVTNGDKARETFRGLVAAAANAGNIELATELVKLSGAFAEVTPLAEKFLKSLQAETKNLEIELLKAQGNTAGYTAALRTLETQGMTRLEVATYDYNKSLEAQIEMLGKVDEAKSTAASAEVRLLEAQGKATEALAKQREIDTKGMSAAEAAAYDYSKAVDNIVEFLEKLKAATETTANAGIRLLNAQGRSEAALAKQRELDIASMSRAEVVAYDYAAAIDAQISKIEKAADIVSKLGSISADLGTYLQQFEADTSERFSETIRNALEGDLAAMGEVTSQADKAIENARKSSRSTAEFNVKQATLLGQVRKVKDFADTVVQLSDTDKIIAAVKGDTKTSEAVNALKLKFDGGTITAEIDATLTSIEKSAGAISDTAAIQSLFSNIKATITAMTKDSAATAQGQTILGMFSQMQATVLNVAMTASETEIAKVTSAFSSLTAFVTKVSASNLPASAVQTALGTSANITAAINAVTAKGVTSTASQTVLGDLANVSAIVNKISIKDLTSTSVQTALGSLANTTAWITKLEAATGIVTTQKDAIKTALSGFTATITNVTLSDTVKDTPLKNYLSGKSTTLSAGMSIGAAITAGTGDFGLTAQQTADFLNANKTVNRVVNFAKTGATISEADRAALEASTGTVEKTLNLVKGSNTLTDTEKTLLGIIGGSENGYVTVQGTVEYEAAKSFDTLIGELNSAISLLTTAVAAQAKHIHDAVSIAKAQATGKQLVAEKTSAIADIKSFETGTANLVKQHGGASQASNTNSAKWAWDNMPTVSSTGTPGLKLHQYFFKDQATLDAFNAALVAMPKYQDAFDAAAELSNSLFGGSQTGKTLNERIAAARKQITDLGGIPEFARGGYTGPGSVNEVAGIVHKGEVVWSQQDIANAGGLSIVEALRKGGMPEVASSGGWEAVAETSPASDGGYNVTQTSVSLDETALLEELKLLREEVASLRYEARATAVNTGNTTKYLRDFDARGLTVKTDADTPLHTTTV